jgi:cbb3-type cytochrome oxidase subunit 3
VKSLTDVVSGAGLAGYAEVALLIFFLVFVAVGLRVLFSAKTTFASAARMPLDDEPVSHTTNTDASTTGASRGPA